MKRIEYKSTNTQVAEGEFPQHLFEVVATEIPVESKSITLPKVVKVQVVKDGAIVEIDTIEYQKETVQVVGSPRDIVLAVEAIGAATKEEALAQLKVKHGIE